MFVVRLSVREEVRKIGMFIVVREEEGLTGGLSPADTRQGTHNTLWLQSNITNIIAMTHPTTPPSQLPL